MRRLLLAAGCLTLALVPLQLAARSASKFQDPLDTPAKMRTSPDKRPLMAVTPAGERLVAVGSRGVIILSDDRGRTWSQAKVPVQSDLLAVSFPTPKEGWAVGHDGVVLHSADGGKVWVKQFDGRMAGDAFKAFYAAMGPEGAAAQAEIGRNYRVPAALPWLDVWFETPLVGYVVGSYGMLAATTDGGKSWEPWLHRIDNGEALNLNAIRSISGNIYIAGERGQIYRFDRTRGHFTRTDTGYLGSFFGMDGANETLLAYGLRGTVFRSTDSGTSWHAFKIPTAQTITAGIARPDGKGFVLADAVGQLLLIDNTATSVNLLPESTTLRATGIAPVGLDAFAVTGLEGIRIVTPNAAAVNTR